MGMYDDALWDDRENNAWDDDPIVITKCELIHTTEKGYLIRVPNSIGYREAWFPCRYSLYEEGKGLSPNRFSYAPWIRPSWKTTRL